MNYAIVLAAGTGKRMNSQIPKQYMDLCGKPVLYYALAEFEKSNIDRIVIVTGQEDISYVKDNIVKKYGISKVTEFVEGGKERYNSVYNALSIINDADYVLIHDGARPFVSRDLINNMINDVKEYEACIAAVPVKDTIKSSDEYSNVLKTIPRKNLWSIQTPQAFNYKMLLDAYKIMLKREDNSKITDDSMIWEEIYRDNLIKIIESDYNNFKVTTPEDMLFGRAIVDERNKF